MHLRTHQLWPAFDDGQVIGGGTNAEGMLAHTDQRTCWSRTLQDDGDIGPKRIFDCLSQRFRRTLYGVAGAVGDHNRGIGLRVTNKRHILRPNGC